MNEFGFYDPWYDLTENELQELLEWHEWVDSVDTTLELCQNIDIDQDIPF